MYLEEDPQRICCCSPRRSGCQHNYLLFSSNWLDMMGRAPRTSEHIIWANIPVDGLCRTAVGYAQNTTQYVPELVALSHRCCARSENLSREYIILPSPVFASLRSWTKKKGTSYTYTYVRVPQECHPQLFHAHLDSLGQLVSDPGHVHRLAVAYDVDQLGRDPSVRVHVHHVRDSYRPPVLRLAEHQACGERINSGDGRNQR